MEEEVFLLSMFFIEEPEQDDGCFAVAGLFSQDIVASSLDGEIAELHSPHGAAVEMHERLLLENGYPGSFFQASHPPRQAPFL